MATLDDDRDQAGAAVPLPQAEMNHMAARVKEWGNALQVLYAQTADGVRADEWDRAGMTAVLENLREIADRLIRRDKEGL